jgi:hypothetical protein
MRIVLGKIDAEPARGGLMAIKVQANTGSVYEIMVDPEHTSRLQAWQIPQRRSQR